MSAPLRVGLDFVDVERFASALARRPRLAERIFTSRERAQSRGRAERLAARFAAKEATWKALGVGLGATALHDVEVVSLPSGEPTLVLSGRAAQLAERRGLSTLAVSLTHTERAASAVVVGAA